MDFDGSDLLGAVVNHKQFLYITHNLHQNQFLLTLVPDVMPVIDDNHLLVACPSWQFSRYIAWYDFSDRVEICKQLCRLFSNVCRQAYVYRNTPKSKLMPKPLKKILLKGCHLVMDWLHRFGFGTRIFLDYVALTAKEIWDKTIIYRKVSARTAFKLSNTCLETDFIC